MNHILSILQSDKQTKMKEFLIVYRAFKETVNEQILNATKQLYFKNNILFIETDSHAWANQFIYFKHKILKKMKEKVPFIKDIKTIVIFVQKSELINPIEMTLDPISLKEEEFQILSNDDLKPAIKRMITKYNNRAIKPRHRCKQCHSVVLKTNSQICNFCENDILAKKRLLIQNILKESPWVKYNDCDENFKQLVLKSDFNQGKRFYIAKLYDTINQYYFEVLASKSQKKGEIFRQKLEELVLLKSQISPENLTTSFVTKNISQRKYVNLYNKFE
jgi:hypothetical protein